MPSALPFPPFLFVPSRSSYSPLLHLRSHPPAPLQDGNETSWDSRSHSLGSRKCVAIAMITYPDPGTHRWSRALQRTSTKVGAAGYHGGYDSTCRRRRARARTSRCTRALLSVPVPTAVLVLSFSGAAHRRTALPHMRGVGCSGPDDE
ncbi:hypothetical protein K438DRAFT_2014915 [Mycena galopus ATCC 62051]|nr:hypothetical protein K438DRAFT_2014915 [Mycena galopus ATCC 62051]